MQNYRKAETVLSFRPPPTPLQGQIKIRLLRSVPSLIVNWCGKRQTTCQKWCWTRLVSQTMCGLNGYKCIWINIATFINIFHVYTILHTLYSRVPCCFCPIYPVTLTCTRDPSFFRATVHYLTREFDLDKPIWIRDAHSMSSFICSSLQVITYLFVRWFPLQLDSRRAARWQCRFLLLKMCNVKSKSRN